MASPSNSRGADRSEDASQSSPPDNGNDDAGASDASASSDSGGPPDAKKVGWGGRVLKVSIGLVVGLLLAEALFWWRDDGAFRT